ncbi:MAG TPA: Rieske 2Fe-2S domain-containing protein [Candidatus Limnocylindrales bacterium]|nr:Rieske 2Fe-2S domain-containing protein [Candidatus Limnocylindrales bacterium]
MEPKVLAVPGNLFAPGTRDRPFTRVAAIADLPAGQMARFTTGDLDVLVAHTEDGICVTDDRCPHMAAPLSVGSLTGCVVACPLHRGAFDLATGDVVQFPTTGGLDADGNYHAPWTPVEAAGKPEPTDLKARARALTRVRRMRYYPVRLEGDWIEAQLPD